MKISSHALISKVRFAALYPRNAFVLLVFLLVSASSIAQIEVVRVGADLTKLNVSSKVGILEEGEKQLTFEQVKAFSDNEFEFTERRNVYRHYGVNPCWFKLKLQLDDTKETDVILQLANPKLSKVELYQTVDNQVLIEPSGEYYPFADRDIYDRYSVFKLRLKPGQTDEIYFRIDNAGNYIDLPVVVWEPVQYMNHSYRSQFTIALYYGVVILITFVIICLLVLTRSKLIFIYFLYAVSLSAIQFVRDGFGVEFIWNGLQGFNHTIVSISVAGTVIFGTWFSIIYLQTATYLPRYHKYLKIYLWLGLASVVGALIPYTSLFVLEYNKVLVLLSIVSVVTAGILSLRKNKVAARFYVAGYGVLFIGVIIVLMLIEGFFYSDFLEAYALKLASVIEILILTIAMVHYVREEQRKTQGLAYERLSKINKLTQQANKELTERIALSEELRLSELRALHAQMNPHFIFNALNSVQFYILDQDHERAVRYLTRFSKLMRNTLDNSREAAITIEEEIETVDLYLQLESMRFDHRFSYVIDVDEKLDVNHAKIPPMLIQPYVENAIWHGIMNKEEKEKGHVAIQLTSLENGIECIIEDNGVGRKVAGEIKRKNSVRHNSAGMNITQKRLELLHNGSLSGYKHEIEDLVDSDGRALGTRVRFTLDFDND